MKGKPNVFGLQLDGNFVLYLNIMERYTFDTINIYCKQWQSQKKNNSKRQKYISKKLKSEK